MMFENIISSIVGVKKEYLEAVATYTQDLVLLRILKENKDKKKVLLTLGQKVMYNDDVKKFNKRDLTRYSTDILTSIKELPTITII